MRAFSGERVRARASRPADSMAHTLGYSAIDSISVEMPRTEKSTIQSDDMGCINQTSLPILCAISAERLIDFIGKIYICGYLYIYIPVRTYT